MTKKLRRCFPEWVYITDDKLKRHPYVSQTIVFFWTGHSSHKMMRYMIGSLSLSLVREHCGKFIARTTRLTSDGNSNWDFLGETTLHQLGYNVVDGNLTASERQSLLICLVESNQLSLFEIIATIEQNIRMFANNHRMQNAIIKWRSDLQFLNEYIIKQNEKAASHRM